MAVANGTFGKRVRPGTAGQRAPTRKTANSPRQPSARQPAQSREDLARQARTIGAASEHLRIPHTWWDAAIGAFLVFAGWSAYAAADEPHLLGATISAVMVAAGAVMLANHLTGRAKLIVDDEGMRSECLVFPRKIYWKDLHAFNIVTVNWVTNITAKSLKMDGSQSSGHMRVPNAAFKRKDLAFVETLLAHRPDMAEATLDVMKHLGVAKLVR